MLVAAQAGMFVVVVVVVMLVGMSDDGQQREGQGKQQVAHGGSPLNCSLRYNKWRTLASFRKAWEHSAVFPGDAQVIRIRGHIGELPVDLSVELDEQDWAQLTQQLPNLVRSEQPARTTQSDDLWLAALQLLREAEQMEGPQLLTQLEALSGSAQAGKRLLVRLRHSAQVRVHNGVDAPVFSWIG